MACFKVKYDKNGKPVKSWIKLSSGKWELLPRIKQAGYPEREL